MVKPSFGHKELKSVCPHFLGVPVNGAEVRCDASVACIPRCFAESSCVGQRPATAEPQSAKRTGADACDAGKATKADSAHNKPCNKRTRHEQEARKVKSIPLTVLHESDAQATEEYWIDALFEALATPDDDAMLLAPSAMELSHVARPAAMPSTNASAFAGRALQQPRHCNDIPVPVSSASAAGNVSAPGRPARSASKACASTFTTDPAHPNMICVKQCATIQINRALMLIHLKRTITLQCLRFICLQLSLNCPAG